ncbi:hypothetical protein B0O80DRAFT_500863 [Mortierella sp. GBAus27b]|nr:hypothetical protein B0O80DRAFT_500863 [Mortierella sp. GBAus27b]
MFNPHLWACLDIVNCQRLGTTQQQNAFHAALEKHGSHVHEIYLEFTTNSAMPRHIDAVLSSCCNLQRLSVRQNRSSYDNHDSDLTLQHWQELISLLDRNPRIEELTVQLLRRAAFPTAFWRTVAFSLPQIRILRIHGALIDVSDKAIDTFVDACLVVQSLDLDFTTFECSNQHPCSSWTDCRVFPILHRLDFFVRTQLDFEFLSKCLAAPTLRTLRLSTRHLDHYAPAMLTPLVTQRIVEAKLAALESLELWDGFPYTDMEIAAILNSLGRPLKELSVVESGFRELAMKALLDQPNQEQMGRKASHCTELQKLDLSDCLGFTEEMNQVIQESCPKLNTFYSPIH